VAPTAVNRQPFQFIVIQTQGARRSATIYHREWFTQAPLLIAAVLCWRSVEPQRRKNYAMVDTTIAMDHLILAATARDWVTCWVAAFDSQAAREVLNLPQETEPVAFTPLGYPRMRKGKNADLFPNWSATIAGDHSCPLHNHPLIDDQKKIAINRNRKKAKRSCQ
jgi:nitroreductase